MTEIISRVIEAAVSEVSPENSSGSPKETAGGYGDGGVTCPQLPFCKQLLLPLTAAASAAGKAGSTYKIFRPFHNGTLWEILPGTNLSQLQLTPSQARHCSAALCAGKGNCCPQPPCHPRVCF